MQDEISTLAERHLAADRTIEVELVEFGRLSADKRRVVVDRLRIIDRYLGRPGRPTAQHAEAAAAELGTSVRQFKHMIVKMREFGPVQGLAPHLTRKRQTATARQGLPSEIEKVMTAQLAANPRARLSQVSAAIVRRCTELELPVPSSYSIRQRFLERRAQGRVVASMPFGTEFALDQVKINLPCSYNNEEGREVTSLPTLTLLLDVGTQIIVGYGLQEHLFEDVGIVRAIIYSVEPVEAWLSGTDLPVARKASRLTWIVPPDLEQFCSLAGTRKDSSNDIELSLRATGPRRHGTEILKYLGDRLGPYQLYPRRPFDAEAPISDTEGVPYDRATELVGYCVAAWNEARLRDQGAQAAFPTDRRQRQIKNIIGEVEDVLAPVIDAVAERNHAMPISRA